MRRNIRVLSIYAAILMAALSFGTPANAESIQNEQFKNIGVDNFGQVNERYFRGGQPEDGDYKQLASIGIKTIINLTSDDAEKDEKEMVQSSGMKYYQIPMTTHAIPTPDKLAEFFKIVNDPANQPVYVHCVGGRHRTGVMTAVYRMTEHAWTAEQAFKEMKQFKFGADFLHPEFKRFVFDYYNKLSSSAIAASAND